MVLLIDAVGSADAQTLANRGGLSGSWYDPAHDGEGLIINQVDERRVLVYWFTYDQAGGQRWLVGQGLIEGFSVQVEDLWLTEGPRFGSSFDPAQLELIRFGSLLLEHISCQSVTLSWQREAALAGQFGPSAAGEQALRRLAQLDGLECSDQATPISAQGWQQSAAPEALQVAYPAVLKHQGRTYLAGGAGAQAFRSQFVVQTESGPWADLMPLPEERIGGYLLGAGDSLYFFGGSADAGFGGSPNCIALICGELTGVGYRRRDAWRYAIADDQWTRLPDMPQAANMGGGVAMDGSFWLLDGFTLALLQFEPQAGQWTVHDGPLSEPRAQSALVALDGELWLIGGRDFSDERRDVFVYSPTQQRWRPGPPLREPRAGHTAVVISGQIVVLGGERWFPPGEMIASGELLVPGGTEWLDFPDATPSVHGAVGVVDARTLTLLGGSRLPRRSVPPDVVRQLTIDP